MEEEEKYKRKACKSGETNSSVTNSYRMALNWFASIWLTNSSLDMKIKVHFLVESQL